MGREDLTNLLEEASAAVEAPAFAGEAWSQAQKVRRRRRVLAAGAAATAVLAVVGVSVAPFAGDRTPPVVATQPVPAMPAVDVLPERLPMRYLNGLPTQTLFPREAQAQRAVTRAAAVVQPYDPDEELTDAPPIYALGIDGVWTHLNIPGLVPTHDGGGNRAYPLRATSLSPDRRRVAIPQPEALLVVDLTTSQVHRITVPGLNEQVLWHGNRHVLVGQGGPGGFRVDWRAGAVTPLAGSVHIWNSAGQRAEGEPVPEMTEVGGNPEIGERPELGVRTWRLDDSRPQREAPIDAEQLNGHRVDGWHGQPVYDGADRVARGGWGSGPTFSGMEVVAVVNTRTGVVERLLDMGRGRWKGCCTPLEWVDAETVLIKTEKEGLITWNVRNGEIVQALAGPVSAAVSIRLHDND